MPSRMVVPPEYRSALLLELKATELPLEEAVRGLFRGRDFFGKLQGRPADLEQIRATLASDEFFGCGARAMQADECQFDHGVSSRFASPAAPLVVL
jgi:hypothetical protein